LKERRRAKTPGRRCSLAAKGGTLHRKSGILFVYAMVTMGTTASILALRNGFNTNFLGGLTSVYFVTTALTARMPTARFHFSPQLDWSERRVRAATGA
jgi:hypothetical protein